MRKRRKELKTIFKLQNVFQWLKNKSFVNELIDLCENVV